MKQPSPAPRSILPEEKIKFMELNAELRDLKSQESLADYERAKGILSESECNAVKNLIQERFQKILNERNNIINNK